MGKEILHEIKRVREIMNLNEELLSEQAWLKNLFKFGGSDIETIGKDLSKDSRERLFTAFKSGDEAAMGAARETLFGHVANQLAAEGVDLRKYLKPSEGGQIQYVLNAQSKQELASKIKSAMGVNDDRAVADFLKDYRLKQTTGAGADFASNTARTSFPKMTATDLRSAALNPTDVNEVVSGIANATGKNVSARTLDAASQQLFDAIPGASVEEKLLYLKNQGPTMESVLTEREQFLTRQMKRTEVVRGAKGLLANSLSLIDSIITRLPSNPRQFAGMVFKVISGFAVVGAIGGIVKPDAGHSRFYSALNGVTFGLLNMFNEPSKPNGSPQTAQTQQTQQDSSGPQSFSQTQQDSSGPQSFSQTQQGATTTATQTNQPQKEKLTWY